MILRIVGLLCLGGVGIAGWWWWNTDRVMNPVLEEAIISVDKITTLAFTPNRRVSESNNNVRLYFDKKQDAVQNCSEVKSIGIRWAIEPSDRVKSWNTLASTDYECEAGDDLIIISFPAPSFVPDIKYYFHLSMTDRQWNGGNVKVNAAIQHPDGISTHYLFMDKAVAELIGGGLLILSFICFTTDLSIWAWKRFRRR